MRQAGIEEDHDHEQLCVRRVIGINAFHIWTTRQHTILKLNLRYCVMSVSWPRCSLKAEDIDILVCTLKYTTNVR